MSPGSVRVQLQASSSCTLVFDPFNSHTSPELGTILILLGNFQVRPKRRNSPAVTQPLRGGMGLGPARDAWLC